MSVVLAAYLHLIEMQKKEGRFPVITYYLHRYLRLTMVYAFVLFFFWTLGVHLGNGPMWKALLINIRSTGGPTSSISAISIPKHLRRNVYHGLGTFQMTCNIFCLPLLLLFPFISSFPSALLLLAFYLLVHLWQMELFLL